MKIILGAIVLFIFVGVALFFFRTPSGSHAQADVTVQPNQPSYATRDAIAVTLTNKSPDIVYVGDHRSNCTIIMLERLIGSTWHEENQCALLTSPIAFSLESTKNTVVQLDPLPSGWAKGTYRVTVVVHPRTADTSPLTISSARFQVQ